MTETMGLMFAGLFGMVLLNVPIAIALGMVAVIAIWLSQGTDMLPNVALVMFEGATNFPLLAIPLFIFAGGIMNSSSISRRLINLASAMLGFVRGGLAMVTIGSSMFFAEISGSAVAGVAALGSLLIPAMKSRGYSKEYAAAISSSSASLAIILPPSIPMILYAVMAQVSVVKMFISGLLPGLLGGAGLALASWYYAVKHDFPVEQRFAWSRLVQAFREAIWALMLPVVILGGIFGGFVTATEGAAVAVVAALFISTVIYRELDLRALYRALVDGALQTAVVMLLVASSALVGVFLTESRVPQALASSIAELTTNPYMVLLLLNILFLILGMFLHSAAAIILTVPIILPLIQQVGIDPVHFGLVLTLNLAIGQQTPPVASVLIAACSIAKSDIWQTTKANVGFLVVLLAVLMICTYVPWFALAPTQWFYGDPSIGAMPVN
ncbi:TRAP dicarboxylate transporter, DctM subunit [Ancylobacter novellus DSM 506]|uniref:TRAP transporter large permease protein n=1 Tax=Ancylobacter novellus (strain ATCC 8093 / DSM 506 / JCM 20403 / CCM 1077 / IAM 12100 / NBRC 12443 / NCIMB 10456) TaxID=639283 RepID=D7A4G0_ANCN5|nr:TRAP transporter large permease [Ancylobacter novellus]ADH89823.1 TRAP dicarboxylate transporter, DctM subunit [Ancylobacter novellus DSM 506]